MKTLLILALLTSVAMAARSFAADAYEWQSLFNGKDLAGWDTFLGRANPGETNYGLNLDPEKVFTVSQVDGGPVIHVSGKYWGGIITMQEFANYHLRLEFKWGEKTWPPRVNAPLDSGICYHCVGPLAADPVYPWPRSFEFNIARHDVGEFWSVDYTIVDAEVVPIGDSPEELAAFKAWCERNGANGPKVKFQKGGKKQTFRGGGFMPGGDFEKAVGQWNTLDLVALKSRPHTPSPDASQGQGGAQKHNEILRLRVARSLAEMFDSQQCAQLLSGGGRCRLSSRSRR